MEDQPTHIPPITANTDLIQQILELVTQKTGVDLLHYKYTTLQRRIMRRLHLLGMDNLATYLDYLRQDEPEQHRLYTSLLIHVSSFFRDEKSFDYLCAHILPALLQDKKEDQTIRVWVCGCSTGEEAYSIAICLHEHAKLIGNLARIKIFASDLSETAIAKARSGVYSPTQIEKLTAQRQQAYFTATPEGYKINPFIRELCVFAVHNVLADPPFAQIDLISCRNVLIYMQAVLQRKVLASFAYALKETGYLFLGKSETSGLTANFNLVNKGANIFINKAKHGRLLAGPQPTNRSLGTTGGSYLVHTMEKKDFQYAADELLLSRYVPAAVVVNSSFDIVDFKGNTGFYIEPSPGIASFNVLKMVRKGLYYDLNEALGKARAERIAIKKDDIALEHEGKLRRITLEVLPLAGTREKYYLVLFHHNSLPAETEPASARDGIYDTRDLRILQLEQELLQSREQLRALSEEQEATSEEFQSANEELKTLNEELHTANKEVISINEELLVRNKELGDLNKELHLAKELADSITNTVSDALLVLSHDLRVRTANTCFYDTFAVLPTESEGKYVYELGNGQWNIAPLRILLEEVLPKQQFFQDFMVNHTFETIGERTMKLSGRQIKGQATSEPLILLTIDDVTELTKANQQLQQSQQRLAHTEERQRLAIEATHSGIWDYDRTTDQLFLSKEAGAIIGIEKTSSLGWQSLLHTVVAQDKDRLTAILQAAIDGHKAGFFKEEYQVQISDDQTIRWVLTAGRALVDDQHQLARFIGIVTDITDRKRADLKLQEALARLDLALQAGRSGTWELVLNATELISSAQFKVNLGLPPEAELTYDGLLDLVLEEDKGLLQQALDTALWTKSPYHAEYRVRWPDESVHWLEAAAIMEYDLTGQATSLVGIQHDITARKEVSEALTYSEHHFRTLANSAPVLVGMCDAQMNFYFFNKQWQTFAGAAESVLRGQKWNNFIHPEDWPSFEKVQTKAIKKHHRFSIDIRLRSLGKYRWVTCSAEPRFGVDNRFEGYTIACADIHAQKMLSEELERKVAERTGALEDLNEELLDRNRELKQFAYVTSHDLQEPLRKIKIFASMLLAKEANENAYLADYLSRIEFSATRMMGLIHDLLSYSSIQDRSFSFMAVDLSKVIQNVLTDFDLLIQEKGAIISLSSLPIIDAIPLQMNQLFYNLFSNALKFTKAEVAPHISLQSVYLDASTVRNYPLDPAQQYVKISITDNGIGFSAEYNERIFEIFQRLHTRETYGGNGIGLALCKRIVTNHGGLLIPSSQEGEGTTFEVILPDKQV